jgi:hypothetical protein
MGTWKALGHNIGGNYASERKSLAVQFGSVVVVIDTHEYDPSVVQIERFRRKMRGGVSDSFSFPSTVAF